VAGFPISVNEAAEHLQLSPQRVRALIASGDLPAERIGGRYVLDPVAVASFRGRERSRGRPLSARNAWAILAQMGGRSTAVNVSPRSHYRLQGLLQSNGDALVRALSSSEPRSREERWRVLPSDLRALARDSRVILSGLSADDRRIDVRHQVERDGLEGYASEEVIQALDLRLKPEKRSDRPNLVLRAPRGSMWILDERRAPWPVVAADLLNHDDPRVRRSARAALTRGQSAD
jgi:excisionase family DNA binding protein